MVCLKGRREGPVDLPERRRRRALRGAGNSFPEFSHEHDVLRPLAQGAGGCLAMAEFLTRRDRLQLVERGTGKLLINEPALDKRAART